jgi:hypothetical protein
MTDWIMIGVALAVALVTLRPALMKRSGWRATVTPLASIIGSGFLVAGPILGATAGRWAVLAMSGLCAVAWLFGSAIRTNIRFAEPLLDPDSDHDWDDSVAPIWLPAVERLSDLALGFAYFISVAYYLNLFAAFGLRTLGIRADHQVALVSCAVIALLGALGMARGLRWLENIELPAVGLKLALIAGLLAGLGWWLAQAIGSGQAIAPLIDHATGAHEIGVLLGLIVLVQGFETSRCLGASYSAERRIATMRGAQLLASAIYIVFIALMTPHFAGMGDGPIAETEIIDLLTPLGWAVAPLVTVAALASQLSAAVADMSGAGGLIHSGSEGRVPVRLGYGATAVAAIAITLSANIFEIIVYASKAFVSYYALQCACAALLRLRRDSRNLGLALLYGLGVAFALAVLALGVPAA